MALSLFVLIVPIVVLLGIYRFLGGESPADLDVGETYATARSGGLPVLEPRDLPAGWRAMNAGVERTDGVVTLRVAYAAPGGGHLQLVQSARPVDRLVVEQLGTGAGPTGKAEIAGRTWVAYLAETGDHALVLHEDSRTVVVAGRLPDESLRAFVATLR